MKKIQKFSKSKTVILIISAIAVIGVIIALFNLINPVYTLTYHENYDPGAKHIINIYKKKIIVKDYYYSSTVEKKTKTKENTLNFDEALVKRIINYIKKNNIPTVIDDAKKENIDEDTKIFYSGLINNDKEKVTKLLK
ncbi:MAG: hypothetical protein SO108_05045 [Bacilli bacterium]|nr:hypothetical protein [Bacilli bacterium]